MDTNAVLGGESLSNDIGALEKQANLIDRGAWLSIWIWPKDTIRRIVTQNPEYGVHLLAALYGVSAAYGMSVDNNFGDAFGFIGTVIFILIAGPIIGFLGLYIEGALLKWSGGILGGQATRAEVRAAVAWSAVPTVLSLVLNAPALLVFGNELFTSATPRADAWLSSGSVFVSAVALILVTSLGVKAVLWVWGFIITVSCLSEVHRISAKRAFVSILIPGIIFLIPLFLCVIITSL